MVPLRVPVLVPLRRVSIRVCLSVECLWDGVFFTDSDQGFLWELY